LRTERRRAGTRAKCFLLLASLAFAVLAIELFLQAGYFLQHRANPSRSQLHDEWGWRSTPDLETVYMTRGYGLIEYSTDADGFRVMGDPDSNRTKILVIGDSFTQAYQVSDGKAYYDFVVRNDDRVELFAYGVGGYATLQQTLVLRHFLERIDPDIILWQFHPNDLIGSSVRLESLSGEHNNHMVRPYLEGASVVRRHPDGLLGVAAVRSVLFRRLAVLRSSIKKRLGTIEERLHPGHPDLEAGLEAMRATIAGLMAEETDRSFVAFQVPTREAKAYEHYVFSRICELERLRCVPGLEQALDRARVNGLTIDGGDDPHWNQTGHETAGRVILDYLQSTGLLNKNDSAVPTTPPES